MYDRKRVADDPWIADQVFDDLNTVGLAENRIIVKTNQESAIVELQTEIARRRGDIGTSIENSKVGTPTAIARSNVPSETSATWCSRWSRPSPRTPD